MIIMLNNTTPRELKSVEEIIAAQRIANLPLQKQSLLKIVMLYTDKWFITSKK